MSRSQSFSSPCLECTSPFSFLANSLPVLQGKSSSGFPSEELIYCFLLYTLGTSYTGYFRVLLLNRWSSTNTRAITWELVRKAEFQAPPQTYWIRICNLTGSPDDSHGSWSVRSAAVQGLVIDIVIDALMTVFPLVPPAFPWLVIIVHDLKRGNRGW